MALPVKKLRALANQHKKGGLKFGKPTDDEDEDEDKKEDDEKGNEASDRPFPPKRPGGGKGSPDKRNDEGNEKDGDESDDELAGADETDDIALANEIGQEIVENGVEDDIATLMEDYDPGENPAWAQDEDIWERAKKAVDPEGEGADKYDEPWAVVATVYKNMGGAIAGGE
jgi:hypothetical protein